MLEVVLSISYFMINFCDAASKSSLPVVSTYCGERNESGMRLALRTGMLYALITGAALAAVVLIFPDQICRFFGLTELEMLDAGRGALRWYACCIPIAAASIMFGGFYEARTQERDTLVLSSLRGILPIVLALIFTFFAPEQFWLLFPISEGGALLVFALYKLIASRPPFDRSRVFSKTIYSRNMEISETTEQIEEFCAKWDTPVKQQYFAAMALEEICVAMLDNGFRGKEDGFIQITLIVPEEGGLELHIRDNAASFNPLAMQMTSENDGEIDMNALGVEAIKKKSKDFSYRHYQGFNTVIIRI